MLRACRLRAAPRSPTPLRVRSARAGPPYLPGSRPAHSRPPRPAAAGRPRDSTIPGPCQRARATRLSPAVAPRPWHELRDKAGEGVHNPRPATILMPELERGEDCRHEAFHRRPARDLLRSGSPAARNTAALLQLAKRVARFRIANESFLQRGFAIEHSGAIRAVAACVSNSSWSCAGSTAAASSPSAVSSAEVASPALRNRLASCCAIGRTDTGSLLTANLSTRSSSGRTRPFSRSSIRLCGRNDAAF